jgi:uncharacterized protein (TIGR00369 family)
VTEKVNERIIRWDDPGPALAIVRNSTGLAAMQAWLAGDLPAPPIGKLMNMRLVDVERGRVVFEGEPGEEHYNPIGIVHGGFALTLMDSALGCAVHTTLDAGVGYTTTDTQVRFIRAITTATGVVRCEGTIQHVGRTTAVAHGTLVDRNGKLLATGTSACAIIRS